MQSANTIVKPANNDRKAIVLSGLILVAIIAVIGCVAYSLFQPSASPWYYGGIIDKLGAPSGFTVDKTSPANRQEYQGFLWSNPYASRDYVGSDSAETIRAYYIAKLSAIGFHNAHWQDASDGNVAAVKASCKGTVVYAEAQQSPADPLQVEVSQNYQDGPACPSVTLSLFHLSQYP